MMSSLLVLLACNHGYRPHDLVPSPGEEGAAIGFTDAHNQIRTPLGVPELVYDPELAEVAADWLVELERRGCVLEHDLASPYGENLAWNKDFRSDPYYVMEGWVSEEANYDYDTNTCSSNCGHYTQVIWADTVHLGCAMRECEDRQQLWMCVYDPIGNIEGERPY